MDGCKANGKLLERKRERDHYVIRYISCFIVARLGVFSFKLIRDGLTDRIGPLSMFVN